MRGTCVVIYTPRQREETPGAATGLGGDAEVRGTSFAFVGMGALKLVVNISREVYEQQRSSGTEMQWHGAGAGSGASSASHGRWLKRERGGRLRRALGIVVLGRVTIADLRRYPRSPSVLPHYSEPMCHNVALSPQINAGRLGSILDRCTITWTDKLQDSACLLRCGRRRLSVVFLFLAPARPVSVSSGVPCTPLLHRYLLHSRDHFHSMPLFRDGYLRPICTLNTHCQRVALTPPLAGSVYGHSGTSKTLSAKPMPLLHHLRSSTARSTSRGMRALQLLSF
ncbi:hypothetical protein HYPSUDRAFT_196848 [Hypholoma sublateritium FD-334 SS-4]|uniref:Uncharacterized protein n=1 Tax=Hypholoma sublateritium (strain FD-334 SS-4) TaxID=945553 RepID=A0A0D2LN31_HYPSF|nr:hypothetical protein HYPSUDRAFT_196848 [Hypholoma sublateritium FD-334 SS-4]